VGYDYTVAKAMLGLRDHLGKLRISELPDGGSRLDWTIRFEFAGWWAPFVGPFVKIFTAALQEGLSTLKGQVEAG
jgi:hypothetical protein